MRSVRPPRGERPSRSSTLPRDALAALLAIIPGSQRDRFAVLLAFMTVVSMLGALVIGRGTHILMPGPLVSAHSAIENCGSCHTKSGSGKLSWLHGLVAGDPLADSKACLTCHKMPETAMNAHGASALALKQSNERLVKVAATTSMPGSAHAQNIAFPTDDIMAGGLYCATCHQEHKGANFDLSTITNEQCRSCHVVKFDSFDGSHPTFDNYPFKQRTRIIYDHAGHFGKHFPEVAQKDSSKRIPETCSTCHGSRDDKRIMAVAPFEQTCAGCHLDQIIGKERASGPKGIAFLSLPGLDLDTLKEKKAGVGEWPESSEAEITPFMKVLLTQDNAGRTMMRRVEKLNLQDLSNATDEDIAAVTRFVWRVKRLFHSLVTTKASDVVARLDLGGGVKVGKDLMANLTASIPREVIVSAQREWLPNLGKEIANRKEAANDAPAGKGGPRRPAGQGQSNFSESKLSASVAPEELNGALPVAPAGEARIRVAQAVQRAPGQTDDLLYPNGGAPAAGGAPAPAAPAGDAAPAAGASGAPAANAAPPEAEKPEEAEAAAPAEVTPPPAAVIASDVDDESWAEFGGWYRQDYAIFYRPAGHKDKFLYAWLSLTGLQSPKGLKSPAAAVFDALATKDAQGSCIKCHSVDDVPGKGRRVNFSPAKAKTKEGRFTDFIHEPHFGIMENRGCLTCHNLEKNQPYLKSYEQGNPLRSTSNFTSVKKELCQTCHTSSMARQDCLLCHKYHVNGVITPMMTTKIPAQ